MQVSLQEARCGDEKLDGWSFSCPVGERREWYGAVLAHFWRKHVLPDEEREWFGAEYFEADAAPVEEFLKISSEEPVPFADLLQPECAYERGEFEGTDVEEMVESSGDVAHAARKACVRRSIIVAQEKIEFARGEFRFCCAQRQTTYEVGESIGDNNVIEAEKGAGE